MNAFIIMEHLLLIGSMELEICIRQSPDFAGMNASSQTCQKRESLGQMSAQCTRQSLKITSLCRVYLCKIPVDMNLQTIYRHQLHCLIILYTVFVIICCSFKILFSGSNVELFYFLLPVVKNTMVING